MKKIFFLTASMFILLGVFTSSAQIIAEPPEPTDLDAVTINLNTAGTGLENYTGDVYAHTGLTIAGVGPWQYVIGEWGNNQTQPMLQYVSPGIYQLIITPSIRAFYDVPENDEITGMHFVFRSEDGNQQTSDLFWQVYGAVIPDPVAVTFNVDMNYAPVFNPASDDVYIAGSFAGWPMPGSNPDLMMQPLPENPMVYSITIMLEPGFHEYKYFRVIDNTPSWDHGEWEGGDNRTLFVEEELTLNDIWGGGNYILPGDANCDGIVDVLDLVHIVNYIMGQNPQPFCFVNADVNEDDLINVLDVVGTANLIVGK
jgi:hypothetical protein